MSQEIIPDLRLMMKVKNNHKRRRAIKIYWANSLFSEADRKFNTDWAAILRNDGYSVFLPQEANVNHGNGIHSPTAEAIFQVDTLEVINSDILICCLDQETIDSGVACEIGIAVSSGIPIIGVYTDIRQYRSGDGQMYKNLYVVGAILANGKIVSNMNELLETIHEIEQRQTQNAYPQINKKTLNEHFNSVAQDYESYVHRLESFYSPSWNIASEIIKLLSSNPINRILDFGCGTGSLAKTIVQYYEDIFYVGYDTSCEMISEARQKTDDSRMFFTSSWNDVKKLARDRSFDIVLAGFVLHDNHNQDEIIKDLTSLLTQNGKLMIIDLSRFDLPRLTTLIQQQTLTPPNYPDQRLDPIKVAVPVQENGCQLVDCWISTPIVSFMSCQDIEEYLQMFGIYDGFDMPVKSELKPDEFAQVMRRELTKQQYPFYDQRGFLTCIIQKN